MYVKNKGKDKKQRTVMKQRTAMYSNACTKTKEN